MGETRKNIKWSKTGSFSVSNIVNWFYDSHLINSLYHTSKPVDLTVESGTRSTQKCGKKRKSLPYHERIFRKFFLRKNYPASQNYSYPRVKGMLVHDTIDYFIEHKLPSIHLYFAVEIPLYRLWYLLRRSLYLSLLQKIRDRQRTEPQIKVWYPFLLDESMKSLEIFLNHLFYSCVDRLINQHSLKAILEDLTPLIHEHTHSIIYRGYKIFFKPDWIVFELNKAVVIEYKTGKYYSSRFEKDHFQILLFAWLFEKKFNIIVERCEINYMDVKRTVTIEFSLETRTEVKGKLDAFINSKNLNKTGIHPMKRDNQKKLNINPRKDYLKKDPNFHPVSTQRTLL